MWEQCLRADGRQTIDIRLAENPGEVAKYVTKPSAHLKFDGDRVWWCDPERLEALHYALDSRRPIARSRSLSEIRRKLGFLEDDDFDDLVALDEFDDGEAWVQEVLYRWRRNEEVGSPITCG
jgi:Replication protein